MPVQTRSMKTAGAAAEAAAAAAAAAAIPSQETLTGSPGTPSARTTRSSSAIVTPSEGGTYRVHGGERATMSPIVAYNQAGMAGPSGIQMPPEVMEVAPPTPGSHPGVSTSTFPPPHSFRTTGGKAKATTPGGGKASVLD
jgi:hypothetical protein